MGSLSARHASRRIPGQKNAIQPCVHFRALTSVDDIRGPHDGHGRPLVGVRLSPHRSRAGSRAYATAYLGLADPRRIWCLEGADYSYGLFLYHWVVQQALMDVAPRHWLINAVIGLPLSLAVAAASWKLVEQPVMALRRPIMQEDRTEPGVSLMLCGLASCVLLALAMLHRFIL